MNQFSQRSAGKYNNDIFKPRTLRNVVCIKSFGQKPSSNDNNISKPDPFQKTVHVFR